MVGALFLALNVLGCAAHSRISEPSAPLPDGSEQAQVEPGSPAGEPEAAGQGGARIESVTAEPVDTGTIVTIRGDHPLNYTSYDPDATRLVIELPDSNLGSVPPVIEVGTPQLQRIESSRVESRSGSAHARIELVGRVAAQTHIEPRGSDLVVILEGDSSTAAAASPQAEPSAYMDPMHDQGAPNPAQPEPSAAHEMEPMTGNQASAGAPAKRLTAVHVTGSEEAPVVTLEGDGDLEFKSFELTDPPRLVVDVMGVTNGVKGKKIAVGTQAVEQVRVSQFSKSPDKVTRVVFDLKSQVPYHIEDQGSTVAIDFSAMPMAAASEMKADEPAKEMTAGMQEAPAESPKPAPAFTGEEPRPATPQSSARSKEVQPASSSLQEMGRDVVLFDRSNARMAQAGKAPRASDAPSPGYFQPSYESRTIAGGKKNYRGEKISVAFRDADLREVMFFFADVMKMNIVLDPDVSGKVDIRLNQVPWDQAFQVILKNQGLDATEEDNVIRIAKTTKLRTEAADLRSLKQAQELAVDPVTFTRTLSYAKVQDAMSVLQQVKTDRGKIVADIRTNTLIIQDIPDKMTAYNGLLDSLDTQTPQVIIEARIVEAIRSFERDLGINWGIAGKATPALGTQTNLQFPHRVEFNADVNTAPPGFPNSGSIGLMLGNVLDSFTLDIALESFESDGKVRILSSPRIATQNNQPATIEQGVQIPVVTTTATEVDVQYVPASLRLIVTPQITAEDTVIMKVKVENNQPSSTISVSDVPGIVTESVDTQILVRTGTTAVIGGVYKLQETDNETGIPGLRRIPFLGWLFKNKVNKKDSSELLVFITPKIVKNI
jgi:type IV pilus assembly protein PilQ